jgi:AraC family transcriptional regulator
MNTSTNAGEPISVRELPGFKLTERHHQPNWVLLPHVHEVTILSIVLAGSFLEAADSHRIECQPGSLQILPAGDSHSYSFGSARVHCLTIEVKPDKLAEIGLFSSILERRNSFSGGELPALLTHLYQEFRAGDNAATLTVEGLVLETLGAATRRTMRCPSPAPPEWLRRARDLIHEHFAAGVSLTALAASVEVHPSHLTRIFRLHYGCSIGAYVRRLRLEQAARELIASEQTLAEIAVAAGFCDQSHFTHSFKSHLKMTPAAYRAALRRSRR